MEPALIRTDESTEITSGENSIRQVFALTARKAGSPTWIRTTIHGSKGRCPTVRRSGKRRETEDFPSLTHAPVTVPRPPPHAIPSFFCISSSDTFRVSG